MKKMSFSGLFGEVVVPPFINSNAVYRAYDIGFKEQNCTLKTYLTKPGTTLPIEKPSVSLSTHGIKLGEAGHIMPTFQRPLTSGFESPLVLASS